MLLNQVFGLPEHTVPAADLPGLVQDALKYVVAQQVVLSPEVEHFF